MNHVATLDQYPNRCAVLPQLGHDHERGYLDTGQDLPLGPRDSHIYISVVAVEELAKQIGLLDHDQVAFLVAQNEALQQRIDELEEEANRLDVVVQAIDTIESADFRARKRPGKRKKPEEVTVNGGS